MNDDDKEPELWVRVLKLVVVLIVLIVLVGLGLYYTSKFNTYDPKGAAPDDSWGISKDSPIYPKR
jgi:hypothetical protein